MITESKQTEKSKNFSPHEFQFWMFYFYFRYIYFILSFSIHLFSVFSPILMSDMIRHLPKGVCANPLEKALRPLKSVFLNVTCPQRILRDLNQKQYYISSFFMLLETISTLKYAMSSDRLQTDSSLGKMIFFHYCDSNNRIRQCV